MRWSRLHIPTLRQPPNDAEVASHRLLVQAGFIRQLGAGIYNYLPICQRSILKISQIIREEMGAIGGQEFFLAALHPAEVWKQSGRWEGMGANMFRLKDRKDADMCLGMTHEEIFALLASADVRSYKELPQTWYQIQTKFRDEPRPKSGLLRVRQFTMKDSYSLDIDTDGLDVSFEQHRKAYERIYSRCGLPFVIVDADSGSMGGSASNEFMVETSAGEDLLAQCDACRYAANLEKARSKPEPTLEGQAKALETFPTPGIKTIEALEKFQGGAPARGQIKTLVVRYQKKDKTWSLALVLLRGDHSMNETKVLNALGAHELGQASEDDIVKLMGARPGSLGAVKFSHKETRVLADPLLKGAKGLVTGANKDGVHYRGVDVDRDVTVTDWVDVRAVSAGEGCPHCGKPLRLTKCLEVGHIFKLGTKYSESLKAHVLDKNGKQVPIVMGSYGIGVERILASAVEVHHDAKGIRLPLPIAPFEIVITVLYSKTDTTVAEKAEQLYSELTKSGFDVLLDDRNERAGIKFNDADLIGIPIRLVVSDRNLAENKCELAVRMTGEVRKVSLGEIIPALKQLRADLTPRAGV